MFIKETYWIKLSVKHKHMFTTSIFKLMANIPNMFARIFGRADQKEKPALRQSTKLEAAYASINAFVVDSKYLMHYAKADSYRFSSMSKTLPEFIEYLQGYLLLLKSKEGIRISDIRGTPEEVSLTDFLTSDGCYVPISATGEFYKIAKEILDILIVHKDKEVGNESYYIRMLGNTLVSIKNISDALAACKKTSK